MCVRVCVCVFCVCAHSQIMDGDVTEQYVENIRQLNFKLYYLSNPTFAKAKAAKDFAPFIEKLRVKV